MISANFSDYATLMKALGDETRLQIVYMLRKGELCACHILEHFHITQPTLSYHMKTLTESGLVIARKDGSWMKYHLNPQKIDLLQQFISALHEKEAL